MGVSATPWSGSEGGSSLLQTLPPAARISQWNLGSYPIWTTNGGHLVQLNARPRGDWSRSSESVAGCGPSQAWRRAYSLDSWRRDVYGTLRCGGYLVFETRDPTYEGWREWHRSGTFRIVDVDGVGPVEQCVELIDVSLPLVSFRGTWVFPDGEVLTSDSTLRFRGREEVEGSLVGAGFVVDEVRGAPDRPGRELVFFARRPPDR